MSATAADTIDACQARLHAEGFSIGDMAVRATKGTMWVVFAHRGRERLVAKAGHGMEGGGQVSPGDQRRCRCAPLAAHSDFLNRGLKFGEHVSWPPPRAPILKKFGVPL
jgi:hypothetical protein